MISENLSQFKNKNAFSKLIGTAEDCFKRLLNSPVKHLSKNGKVYGSFLSGCLLIPSRAYIAFCDSKSSHTRIVGINSIEKLHQEAKFDWKRFYSIVKDEVWYIACAVVVSFNLLKL